MSIQISGCEVIDNSRCLQNIVNACFSACASTFVTRNASGEICASCYLLAPGALGTSYGGGQIICKSSGVAWIVAPSSTEVSRNWYCRDDAVTTAESNAACGDWFVPTCGQLQNPGYTCRTYWDSYASTFYWSSTECNSIEAWIVSFTNGSASSFNKPGSYCVRAFRCVTY